MRRGRNGMVANNSRKRGSRMNDIILKQTNNNWYSVKEICDSCQVDRRTWVNFKAEFNCENDFPVKRNIRKGDKNVDYYPESVLQKFQTWLMRNQANQGKSSQAVKQATEEAIKFDLAVKAINQTGDVEAMKQLCDVLMDNVKKQNQILVLEQEKTKLVEDNQQLKEQNQYLKGANYVYEKQLLPLQMKTHSWMDDYSNY